MILCGVIDWDHYDENLVVQMKGRILLDLGET